MLALRQSRTAPLLDDLEAYLRALLPSVLPKSPLGKAVQYTLARWPALRVFAGNETGGERAAVIYSLIETCGRLGINPHEYLTDVLPRVGSHPQSRVAELTPLRWLAAKATAVAPSKDQA